jgi:hypothetical protein
VGCAEDGAGAGSDPKTAGHGGAAKHTAARNLKLGHGVSPQSIVHWLKPLEANAVVSASGSGK